MSSGELPQEIYHRTSAVGSGSYGSVVIVYDDDGEEYALKIFDDDDDDDNSNDENGNGSIEDDDNEDDGHRGVGGISLGALREISILRLFRENNSHPNIIAIHDVQTAFGEGDNDDGYNNSNGIDGGSLAMAMPLFPEGSLGSSFAKITTKKQKAVIAHGILSAVAHLHSNGIMHRDIKSDNILLTYSDDDNDIFKPVLIDFSLAKTTEPALLMGLSPSVESKDVVFGPPAGDSATTTHTTGQTHTPSVGTPTYRAPEVVNGESYGLSSDLWSVGVVLLEMLKGDYLDVFKDRGATQLVKESLGRLPLDQPFPTLLRGLLHPDPTQRWTADQALQCDLFRKFGLVPQSFPRIYLPDAIPIDTEVDEVCQPLDITLTNIMSTTNPSLSSSSLAKRTIQTDKENADNKPEKSTPSITMKQKQKSKSTKPDPTLQKRWKMIQKICKWMQWSNPMTAHAVMTYSQVMAELVDEEEDDDNNNGRGRGGKSQGIDDITGDSPMLLDCLVVAHKFFEEELSSRRSVDAMYKQFAKTEFDVDEFTNNEETLFMMMDFCLYPRTIGVGY